MNRYESYKETPYQWIGKIPNHWQTQRVKFVCNDIFPGATPSTAKKEYWDGNIPWIPSGCCHDCDVVEAPKYITDLGLQNSSTKLIPANTTIIALTGATCSQLGYLKIEACANQSVIAFVENEKKTNSRFLFYALRSARNNILTNQTGGAQAGINMEDCKNIILVFPPLEEQKAIADFLDAKTAELDEEKQNCLNQIDLLKELKQSFIKKSILSTERKQIKLKYILKQSDNNLKVGPFGTALKGDDFKTEGYWVYNQRCVLDNNFVSNDTFVTEQKFSELKSFKVYPQDVLITTRGTIGKIAVVPENAPEGILHPCIIRFVIDEKKYDVRLLKYMFNESDLLLTQVKLMSNSTTIDVLYSYNLKNLRLPLISIDEQHSIANFLDQKTANIDEQIKLQEQQIKLIDELKQSIISQAVTGKIKVF